MDRGRDHLHRQACPALAVSIDRPLIAPQTAARTRQRPAFPRRPTELASR